jgi:predicted AlkP superfamily phosphohydrolase/phosphomutase
MVRTLMIGVDGATFTLFDHLTSSHAGEPPVMPFLAGLIARGYRAVLRSTPHPLTPPAWVSMLTGRTPGHHGIFDFVRFEDHGSEVYFTLYDARDIRQELIWSIAGRQGRSVASLNFPMMAPPAPTNGSIVPGFVSWKHLRTNIVPEDLYDRIKALPGFNARDLAWDFEREAKIGDEMEPGYLLAWIASHLPRERQWMGIAEMILREDKPDLLAVMFDGTDKIQHQAWQALDPAYSDRWGDEDVKKVRELALQYYRQLDKQIAQLVGLAGSEAQVFIASDHGFTGSTDVLRINRYLGEKGYLEWARATGDAFDRKREASNFAHLDWSRTQAFCPTASSNGIFIRRQRDGSGPGVAAGDYEAFRERLVADLRALVSPTTGGPAIREFLYREQAFPGEANAAAPDITLVLHDHGFVSVRNVEPAIGRRPTPFGTHHPDGIFIASGAGIEPGRGDAMSILDVAPVLLHSLSLPIPADFEGSVPEALYGDDYRRQHPVRTGAPTVAAGAPGVDIAAKDDIPEDEKQRIFDQLRLLGYLED